MIYNFIAEATKILLCKWLPRTAVAVKIAAKLFDSLQNCIQNEFSPGLCGCHRLVRPRATPIDQFISTIIAEPNRTTAKIGHR